VKKNNSVDEILEEGFHGRIAKAFGHGGGRCGGGRRLLYLRCTFLRIYVSTVYISDLS
jgi:hypothetical protein